MHDRFAAAGRAAFAEWLAVQRSTADLQWHWRRARPSTGALGGLGDAPLRRLYTGPWLDIRVADVELSDGRHLDYRLIRRRTVGTR
ncbi:hypothetical protein [Nonomuraea wenchangensis]|uniref:hypothetical protein n=1 Tax=Nonomuraea wenchangensis TaxID=568860 RepID=UPI003429D3F4